MRASEDGDDTESRAAMLTQDGARWHVGFHATLSPICVISFDFFHRATSLLCCVPQEGRGKASAVSPQNDFFTHRRRNRLCVLRHFAVSPLK